MKQVAEGLSYMDFAMKVELFLVSQSMHDREQYELQNGVFWACVTEMALIVLGFALFCSAPSPLAYMWLHVFHVPRGIMGLNLIARMPRSHDIIA